jgi:hypothetical protein
MLVHLFLVSHFPFAHLILLLWYKVDTVDLAEVMMMLMSVEDHTRSIQKKNTYVGAHLGCVST